MYRLLSGVAVSAASVTLATGFAGTSNTNHNMCPSHPILFKLLWHSAELTLEIEFGGAGRLLHAQRLAVAPVAVIVLCCGAEITCGLVQSAAVADSCGWYCVHCGWSC